MATVVYCEECLKPITKDGPNSEFWVTYVVSNTFYHDTYHFCSKEHAQTYRQRERARKERKARNIRDAMYVTGSMALGLAFWGGLEIVKAIGA